MQKSRYGGAGRGYGDIRKANLEDASSFVVTSKARGLGLQRRFFEEAEKQLEDTTYEYFLGTVHPDNIYSRTNFVKAGYREARRMSKYGGMQRIIMEKEK